MRLALAPKVAVVEEGMVAAEDAVVEEDMVATEEVEGVAVASNHRHSTHITMII